MGTAGEGPAGSALALVRPGKAPTEAQTGALSPELGQLRTRPSQTRSGNSRVGSSRGEGGHRVPYQTVTTVQRIRLGRQKRVPFW